MARALLPKANPSRAFSGVQITLLMRQVETQNIYSGQEAEGQKTGIQEFVLVFICHFEPPYRSKCLQRSVLLHSAGLNVRFLRFSALLGAMTL